MGCQSTIKTKEELAAQFNRDLCKTIFNSLPERKDIDLQKLKEIIKSNTLKCSQKEKFYIIYLWICENIDYDDKSFFAGKFINCTPEYVFKKGKTVCTGYSRLFRDIASFLDLNAQCLCFSLLLLEFISPKLGKFMGSFSFFFLSDISSLSSNFIST